MSFAILKSGCSHSILVEMVQIFWSGFRYYWPKTYQNNKMIWDTFVIRNTLMYMTHRFLTSTTWWASLVTLERCLTSLTSDSMSITIFLKNHQHCPLTTQTNDWYQSQRFRGVWILKKGMFVITLNKKTTQKLMFAQLRLCYLCYCIVKDKDLSVK